jgi:hypothetical protein
MGVFDARIMICPKTQLCEDNGDNRRDRFPGSIFERSEQRLFIGLGTSCKTLVMIPRVLPNR